MNKGNGNTETIVTQSPNFQLNGVNMKPGDYIKTISSRFSSEWRGKIRRINPSGEILVEWKHTDICTWVFSEDIVVTKPSSVTKIEEYWFGYIVVDLDGIALSQKFKTKSEAKKFQRIYKEGK